jgi:hypothetical protein
VDAKCGVNYYGIIVWVTRGHALYIPGAHPYPEHGDMHFTYLALIPIQNTKRSIFFLCLSSLDPPLVLLSPESEPLILPSVLGDGNEEPVPGDGSVEPTSVPRPTAWGGGMMALTVRVEYYIHPGEPRKQLFNIKDLSIKIII